MVRECKCSFTTLSSPCAALGEYRWKLYELTGCDVVAVIHVLEELDPQYNVLIGCNVRDTVGFQFQGSWG